MINVFQPSVGDEELAAVADVFNSSWLGKGPRTQRFETEFADLLGVGAEHLVSVNSCTEALFIAMQVLGVGPGDEVVLPSISFVGAANAVAARGARPVFCDVDPRTLNARTDDVLAALGPHTSAVLLQHYAGQPGDVAAVAALCRDRGIALVEDAASAIGARSEGQACGTFGDIGAWSFDPAKTITTGDGGMLHFRDAERARQAREITGIGMRQLSGYSEASSGASRWWDFEVSSFSHRSITNDLAAAIGSVQLRRLPEFLGRRRATAERYDAELSAIGGITVPPRLPAGHDAVRSLYWVQFSTGVRDAVASRLYERGIYTTFRYPALHRVPAYASTAKLPGAEQAADVTLCLPLHNSLDDDSVTTVIAGLRQVMSELPR